MAKGKSITAGYFYYMGFDVALCHSGVDEIKAIKFADRLAWAGSVANGSITINNTGLFGGENREGGVSGDVEILNGAADQMPNAYLQAVLGRANIPAFRGVFRLLFKRFYIGLNPYLKSLAIQARRTDTRADMSEMWYLAKSRIGDDMNPAHVIYELYTDKHWGLGLDSNYIDEASFMAAADTLVTESHGISFLWDGTKSVSDVLDMVLGQINAVARQNINTGKIELKLVRDDYIIANILLINENDVIKLDSYQRSSWEDTINQVTVIYHDETTDQDKPVTVQDLGNISIQNRIVPKTINFSGVSNGTLAKVLAMREIKVSATPLSSLNITCKRSAYGLNKGDAFKFSWPKYGISNTVFRVADIDYGDLTDSKLIITALEDVFAFEDSVYTNPIDTEWTGGLVAPADLELVKVVEANYWDAIFNISAADRAQLQPDYGLVAAIAARPVGTYFSFGTHCRVAPAEYEDDANGSGNFSPTALITPALIQEVTSTFAFTAAKDIGQVVVGKYAYINDEIVAVTAIDLINSTMTVNRGVLDTVPTAHNADSRIWFSDGWTAFDQTEWLDTDDIDVKLTPITSLGALTVADATEHSLKMANRAARPYPPGNVKINGVSYPSFVTGDILLTWSHRDRLLQTVTLIDQTTGNIGPEPNTTYTVRLYNEATLLSELTEISGTSQLFSAPASATKIELTAVRNGLTAWQTQTLTFSLNPDYKLDFSQTGNGFYIPLIYSGV